MDNNDQELLFVCSSFHNNS